MAFSAVPDAPAPEAEIFSLWVFDTTLAIRLRWPRPLPLIATKILDPSLAAVGRRPAAEAERPGLVETAAAAIALAAASGGHDKIGATAYANLDKTGT